MGKLYQYQRNVRIGFNRFVATLLGFDSLMPLSAGFWAYRQVWICGFMVRILNIFDDNHSRDSYLNYKSFGTADESVWGMF